jgi:hypothetical protein
MSGLNFSQGAQVDKLLPKLKAHLEKNSSSLMQAFHNMDKDRSQHLSADEFGACLKEIGIVLPPHVLAGIVERFDANGDGSISIPEFTTYMSGETDRFDSLRGAAAVVEKPSGPQASVRRGPPPPQQLWSTPSEPYYGEQPGGTGVHGAREARLTALDLQFLARMEGDIDSRRKTSFINELKKDPRFKPSMLEPPKPKFQEVSLVGGPVIKSHLARRTGLETKRPYKWGPLGGYY